MRKTLAFGVLVALFGGGLWIATGLTAPGDVTCNTATVTASVPSHTVAVDTTPVTTIAGDVQTATATVCITEPTPTTTAPPPPPPPPPPPAPPPPPPPGTLPCGSSLDAAYDSASPGADILLGSCGYGGTTITGTSSSPGVTIEAAPGATPTVTGIDLEGADWLTLKGIHVDGEVFVGYASYADHDSLLNLVAHRFDVQGGRDLVIKGGSYGDFNGVDDPGTGDNYANNKIEEYAGTLPTRVTVDGVTIHDLYCVPGNCHAEGLFLWKTRSVTVQNSRFYNDDFYDIFFAGGDDSGAVIQDNFFGDPYIPNDSGGSRHPTYGRATGIEWKNGGSYSNMLVRYNSFNAGTGLSFDGGGGASVRAVGNLLKAVDCGSAAYDYNLFTPGNGGASCGTHALAVSSFPYLNGGNGASLDYHLTGGSPVDYVPGGSADRQLGFDFDGQARPAGTGYDAGADER